MDIPATIAARYFCFASVRHPWDRAVSLWAYCLAHGGPDLTFAEFIHDWQFTAGWFYGKSQTDFLGEVRLDALVRVETLRSDVMTLPPIQAAIREGAKLRPLPRMNATRHPPWQQVVTPELRQVLADRWPDDLALWEAAGNTPCPSRSTRTASTGASRVSW